MKRRDLKTGLLVLPVLAVLGFAVYAAWTAWNSAGDTEMSGHGVVAMVLGVFFTIAVAVVLVGLLLYGQRRDYDQ